MDTCIITTETSVIARSQGPAASRHEPQDSGVLLGTQCYSPMWPMNCCAHQATSHGPYRSGRAAGSADGGRAAADRAGRADGVSGAAQRNHTAHLGPLPGLWAASLRVRSLPAGAVPLGSLPQDYNSCRCCIPQWAVPSCDGDADAAKSSFARMLPHRSHDPDSCTSRGFV